MIIQQQSGQNQTVRVATAERLNNVTAPKTTTKYFKFFPTHTKIIEDPSPISASVIAFMVIVFVKMAVCTCMWQFYKRFDL